MKKHLANIITMTRIISCICMIFTETLSYPFYCFYIWCGFSDILDGFVARTLKITSSFGSKLDTISDLTLYTVMMIKILPYLRKQSSPLQFPIDVSKWHCENSSITA